MSAMAKAVTGPCRLPGRDLSTGAVGTADA